MRTYHIGPVERHAEKGEQKLKKKKKKKKKKQRKDCSWKLERFRCTCKIDEQDTLRTSVTQVGSMGAQLNHPPK